MIHESFRNVRSYSDFCQVAIPWAVSANDRARLWNVLGRMNTQRLARTAAYWYEATFTPEEFNVSSGSYNGSVSRLTKILRYILCSRRVRFSAGRISGNYRISANFDPLTELLSLWNPDVPAPYSGRGRTNRAATPARPVQREPLSASTTVNGYDPAAECNCAECCASRASERRNAESARTREAATQQTLANMIAGFDPFRNLPSSILTSLMLEAATP